MSEVGQNASRYLKEIHDLGAELIAVSKTFPIDKIKEAHSAGVEHFGENYLNEAVEKTLALQALNLKWHYVGRLQKGTLNKVVNRFYMIHTVAKFSHLKAINNKTETVQKVLLQMRHPEDERDYGLLEEELHNFVREAKALKSVELCGLMFLPPADFEGEKLNQSFEWTKACFERIKTNLDDESSKSWTVLSMGMSGDYRTAIQYGSSHVRIGRGVFGERKQKEK